MRFTVFRQISVAVVLSVIALTALTSSQQKNMAENKSVTAVFETTLGNIEIKLYDETPGHKANFIKNIKEGAYNGVLFHRVIKDFMVQTGDPKSKDAKAGTLLGGSDHGSMIPAEFVPSLFHKKGALAAARTADSVNPEKKSSGSQFYIVTGKVYNQQELVAMEKSIQNRQRQAKFDELVREHRDEVLNLRRSRDTVGLQQLQDKLVGQMETALKGKLFSFTPEQIKTYTTDGGAPFLDGGYTVFGEVVRGMDIVEKIEKAETDGNDRPLQDIRILKAVIKND